MPLFLSVSSSQSTNPGSNQSTVNVSVVVSWNYGSYFFGQTAWADANVGGSVVRNNFSSINYPNPTQNGSVVVASHSVTYTHDTNGYRGAVGTAGAFYDSYYNRTLSASGETYGAIDYVLLPGTPGSVTATAVGPVITVVSSEASTPGPTITAYNVSYASSSNGGVSWGAWSAETAMVLATRTKVFDSLAPGLTYKFRVRAVNGDGASGYRESSPVFVAAGGKRWTGSNWALTVAAAKRWNGSSFVSLTTAKRFNSDGSWVNLS